MKKLKWIHLLCLMLLISCGDEALVQTTQGTNLTATDITTYEVSNKSEAHYNKPPVDILYIIDNSGSTLASSFQSVKSQIQQTISTISQEFNYHILFAPLNPGESDSITGYPVMLSHPDTVTSIASLNVVSGDSLNMFAQASGNNQEHGFQRAQNLINYNRSNGIFRNNANTIVVMISNGDDNEAIMNIGGGNIVFDASKFDTIKRNVQKFTKKDSTTPGNYVSNPLAAESFRFMSLVAHSSCNFWKQGTYYKKMSNELYDYQNFSDSSSKDSHDLCTQNYSGLFSSVNNSIRQILVGHRYDHWKISSQSASSIQESDITLTRVRENGTTENIARNAVNGFQYLGYMYNKNTRYYPDAGEPATGLIVKLNGSARVDYPDYIVAKTVTPTEYFGFVALPRDPDLSTVKVVINGVNYGQSSVDGWTYLGWRDVLNTKVPGPSGASVNPAVNKSGYFLQLNGNAIYSSGNTIQVLYKPKPI
jgi:hypothetical protein